MNLERDRTIRIEVGILDPAGMEESVAVDWFGISALEFRDVLTAKAKGTRVLFYVWEACTLDLARVGSFILTRRCDSEGGMIRLFDARRDILRQDLLSSDFEALELIAQWVAALGVKWPHIQVCDGGRSKAEKGLAWDFTALLEYRRAGKPGTPIRHLPILPEEPEK